jgi:hypothetical protein
MLLPIPLPVLISLFKKIKLNGMLNKLPLDPFIEANVAE